MMLLKLIFWMLAFYVIGSWIARLLRGGQSAKSQSDTEVGGEPKHSAPPYNPEDIVDAKFHDVHHDSDEEPPDEEQGK